LPSGPVSVTCSTVPVVLTAISVAVRTFVALSAGLVTASVSGGAAGVGLAVTVCQALSPFDALALGAPEQAVSPKRDVAAKAAQT
jgi:hypothetical protein